ncbi:MAG: hypothetical protein IT373_12835 [Polyangiaceae bacterium]|nr:hypothetical protein [Polyangiaceae bacterium]
MTARGARRTALPEAVAAVVALACLTSARAARADDDDGLYGRFDGDLMLSAEVGPTESFPGEALSVRLGLHYLVTAGVFAAYDESFGLSAQPVWRAFAGGVELRPLFLARFATDFEHGPALLDLFADSFALALGGYVAELPPGSCEPPVRCLDTGLVAAASIELPLLPQIDGPFLAVRTSLRWSEQEEVALDGMVGLTLGWHGIVPTHLVDASDRLVP